jgi:hypothetical protein
VFLAGHRHILPLMWDMEQLRRQILAHYQRAVAALGKRGVNAALVHRIPTSAMTKA